MRSWHCELSYWTWLNVSVSERSAAGCDTSVRSHVGVADRTWWVPASTRIITHIPSRPTSVHNAALYRSLLPSSNSFRLPCGYKMRYIRRLAFAYLYFLHQKLAAICKRPTACRQMVVVSCSDTISYMATQQQRCKNTRKATLVRV